MEVTILSTKWTAIIKTRQFLIDKIIICLFGQSMVKFVGELSDDWLIL